MANFAEFFGKLHPILLHFPLVLLLLGAAVEGARIFRDSPFLAQAASWLFALGCAAAVLTAASGWLLAAHEHIRSDERAFLEWHRWLGVATATISVFAWIASIRQSTGCWKGIRRAIVFITALLLIATGYFGGELVWGRDWF